jgi:6-phosphogluconolactonase (cycloisomerase 2 family)
MKCRTAVILVCASFAFLALIGTAAPSVAKHKHHGHHHGIVGAVYFETNSPGHNYIQVLFRKSNGQLRTGPAVDTGGAGTNLASPFAQYGFALLDSANSVVLSNDGRFLFAVNAGDDSVSSFRVHPHGKITLASHVSSGGDLPVSVATVKKGKYQLVYVVNEWSGTIQGYTVGGDGKLHALAGSNRTLATGIHGAAAMIGFDSTGKQLTVSERGAIFDPVALNFIGSGPDLIDTFKIGGNGLPGAEVANPSVGEDPYGFIYTNNNKLFMTDSGVVGTVTTYSLNTGNGHVAMLDHKAAGGSAPCWVVLSKDEKHAWVTNSLTANISSFTLGANGSLTLNGVFPTTNNSALDEGASRDGRYLYVISTFVAGTVFQSTLVDIYRTAPDGSLTHIGHTNTLPWPGASGLAAS